MNGMPLLQHRVIHHDDARYHGGTRTGPILGCVWHCTAGDTVDGARSWLDRVVKTETGPAQLLPPAKRASYSYLIEKNGAIHRTVPPEMVAFHAGQSFWPGLGHYLNGCTLGVAFANDNGSDANQHDDPLTEEQLESGLWLGVTLQRIHRYPAVMNLGHCEVSPGRKFDPLPRILDMALWRKQLAGAEWPLTIRAVERAA